MINYIFRRLLQAFFTLLVISVVIFGLVNSVPGGYMSVFQENENLTAEDMARLREKFGADDPVSVRYVKWLGNFVQGDWGDSFVSKRPALQEIGDRLGNTLILTVTSLLVTLLVAIPLGILAALKKYSIFDHIATTLAFAGQSLPVFWFGLLLIIVFSVTLQTADGKPFLPGSGMVTPGEDFSLGDLLRHMVLPVTMLSLVMAAGYMRYMRSSMLEVINQDYVRTARAKGLNNNRVIIKHALRNALIPIVTLIALDIPFLFSGALFTETIFSWPGIGRLFLTSAGKTDYPVLMAILMIASTLTVLSSLLVDVIYTFLDPRISYS
ncbi:MAG TPA: ABC transporter permease [Anaerolineaceae bacterium]|nr:ABC transporter permease [Anaerolineaceae bacterium]